MKRLWFNCLMVTIFTFAMLGALYELLQTRMFSALDPIGQAIGDMELSDIAFSIRKNIKNDTNVVIVNIGNLSRGELGDEVRNIIKYKPKVIAFDILFCHTCDAAYDTIGNLSLAASISQAEETGVKVIMAEKLLQTQKLSMEDTKEQDSIQHSNPIIVQNSYEAYVNLDTDAGQQEDLKACRRVNPRVMVNGKYEYAYSTMMAMLYDSVKTQAYLNRNNETEVINYRGNVVDYYGASDSSYRSKYFLFDPQEAMDTAYVPEYEKTIKGKIVLFGFLGADMFDTSWDDKFFTPINVNYAGKTRPDMYGVVVHANIVSMILKGDFVDETPIWVQIVFAVSVLLLITALFFKIEDKLPIWYDLLSLVIQVVIFILLGLAMVLIFSYYSIKLDFTLTLGAVALVGTCFELYNGGILRLYQVITNRFTKPKDEV